MARRPASIGVSQGCARADDQPRRDLQQRALHRLNAGAGSSRHAQWADHGDPRLPRQRERAGFDQRPAETSTGNMCCSGNLVAAFDAGLPRRVSAKSWSPGTASAARWTSSTCRATPTTAHVHYLADTFGSPGVLQPGTDNRITNVAVSDDPAVCLGLNRAAVGSSCRAIRRWRRRPLRRAGGLPRSDLRRRDHVDRQLEHQLRQPRQRRAAAGRERHLRDRQQPVDARHAGKSEHLVSTYISRHRGRHRRHRRRPALARSRRPRPAPRCSASSTPPPARISTPPARPSGTRVATRPDLTYEGSASTRCSQHGDRPGRRAGLPLLRHRQRLALLHDERHPSRTR